MQHTRLNRRSRTPRARLIRELDKLWQQVICRRSGGKCALCGSKQGVSAHHFIKRRDLAYRHELYNGIALCFTCHRKVEDRIDIDMSVSHLSQVTWCNEHRNDKPRPISTSELLMRKAALECLAKGDGKVNNSITGG